jgi:subtilisin family serine protease
MYKALAPIIVLSLTIGYAIPAGAQSTDSPESMIEAISESYNERVAACSHYGPEYIDDACTTQQYIVELHEDHIQQYSHIPVLANQRVGSDTANSHYWGITTYESVASLWQQLPGVIAIEKDTPVNSAETAFYPWNLDVIDDKNMNLDGSFTPAASAKDVYVYVVDSGIAEHQEFGDRIIEGFTAYNDGIGTNDCNGHGTHVASTAVGETLGIAREATLVPVRVLDCRGDASQLEVLRGIEWIIEHVQTHDSPAVVNFSIGGGGTRSLDRAIQELIALDVALVGAIGNTGQTNCTRALFARSPRVVLVGATTDENRFTGLSSHGHCMDIAAPGVMVLGAAHDGFFDSYTSSGTSMASPHVAGVLATALTGQKRSDTYPIMQNLLDAAIPDRLIDVPLDTKNLFLYSPSPEELEAIQTVPPALDGPRSSEKQPPQIDEPELPDDNVSISVSRTILGQNLQISWSFSALKQPVARQSIIIKDPAAQGSEETIELNPQARTFLFPIDPTNQQRVARIVLSDVEGEPIASSRLIPLTLEQNPKPPSLPKLLPPELVPSPDSGELQTWTKRISDNQVKFYAKYPQVGQKIQYLVQGNNGTYREHAWLRIEPEVLTPDGEYPPDVLTNGVYFVRTIDLEPGKNRLRILVDGELVDRTITYVK